MESERSVIIGYSGATYGDESKALQQAERAQVMSRDLNLDRLGDAVTVAVTAARGGALPPRGQYWEFPRDKWPEFQRTLARSLGVASGITFVAAPSKDVTLPVVINGNIYGAGIILGERDGVEVYDVRTLGTY